MIAMAKSVCCPRTDGRQGEGGVVYGMLRYARRGVLGCRRYSSIATNQAVELSSLNVHPGFVVVSPPRPRVRGTDNRSIPVPIGQDP